MLWPAPVLGSEMNTDQLKAIQARDDELSETMRTPHGLDMFLSHDRGAKVAELHRDRSTLLQHIAEWRSGQWSVASRMFPDGELQRLIEADPDGEDYSINQMMLNKFCKQRTELTAARLAALESGEPYPLCACHMKPFDKGQHCPYCELEAANARIASLEAVRDAAKPCLDGNCNCYENAQCRWCRLSDALTAAEKL